MVLLRKLVLVASVVCGASAADVDAPGATGAPGSLSDAMRGARRTLSCVHWDHNCMCAVAYLRPGGSEASDEDDAEPHGHAADARDDAGSGRQGRSKRTRRLNPARWRKNTGLPQITH